jgi:hypothetical protein
MRFSREKLPYDFEMSHTKSQNILLEVFYFPIKFNVNQNMLSGRKWPSNIRNHLWPATCHVGLPR